MHPWSIRRLTIPVAPEPELLIVGFVGPERVVGDDYPSINMAEARVPLGGQPSYSSANADTASE